ncbi:MAG: tyrosine-type recombinase/integrase, partial [Candidatus Micrarchaeota archaeon]
MLTKAKEKLVVRKLEGRRESPRYYLKPEQIRDLIYHAANPRDRCLIKLLAFGGMRREELRQLDVQDIDFDRNLVTIRVAKFGKKRTIPVSQEVLSDIKFLIGERLKGPVFESRRERRISKRQINRIIEGTAERAGIKNPDPHKKHLNPHLLRHSFSRNALRAG